MLAEIMFARQHSNNLLFATILVFGVQLLSAIEFEPAKLLESDVGAVVVAQEYVINLSAQPERDLVSGVVTIKLGLREPSLKDVSIDRIVLHADSLITIDKVTISNKGDPEIVKYSCDADAYLIAFELDRQIVVQNTRHTTSLRIEFTRSNLSASKQGIYLTRAITGDNQVKLYAVLDITGPQVARMVFPCFDNDKFSSTMKVDLKLIDEQNRIIGRESFEIPKRMLVALRVVALVAGNFHTQFDHINERRLSVALVDASAENALAASSTLDIVRRLHNFVMAEFSTTVTPKQLKLFILPELYCQCVEAHCSSVDDKDNDNGEYMILSRTTVIGSSDALLISDHLTDGRQRVRRVLNIARAVIHQYLGAAHGRTTGGIDWHIESAAAGLSIRAVRSVFPELEVESYVSVELVSAALDYNDRVGAHSSLLKLASQSASQCQSKQLANARFLKAAVFWSDLAQIIEGTNFNEPDLLKSLMRSPKKIDTDPKHLILKHSRLGRTKYRLDVFMSTRLGAPTYDVILVEGSAQRDRLVLKIQPIERFIQNAPVMSRLHSESEAVHVDLTISFVDSRNAEQSEHRSLLCEIRVCSAQVANWFNFDDNNHYIFVRTKLVAPRYMRIVYSGTLLNRLATNVKHMDILDTTQLIDDLHGLAKFSATGLQQLNYFVSFACSTNIYLMLADALLRVRESLVAGKLFDGHQMNSPAYVQLRNTLDLILRQMIDVQMFSREHLGGLKERVFMRALSQLVDIGDSNVISMAVAAISNTERLSDVALHTREAVYKMLVLNSSEEKQAQMVTLYMKLHGEDKYDEKMRLMNALIQSRSATIRKSVMAALDTLGPATRARFERRMLAYQPTSL